MLNKRVVRIVSIASIIGGIIAGGISTNAEAAENRYTTRWSGNRFITYNSSQNSIPKVNNKQEFYNFLKNALENFETNVSAKVTNYNSTDYNLQMINTIMLEHPDINYGYAGVQGQISGYSNTTEKTLNLTIQYNLSKNKMKSEKQAVKNKVTSIINSVIKPGMSDVQKELALHDYVVKNADYNTGNYNAGVFSAEDHNAYGVLIKNTGVCESYAKAMYELLNAVGIECKFVTGYSNRGGGHAWNMVKLDNEWYNLDATWDDPISDRNPRATNNSVNQVSHKYFNIPDSIFNRDHIRGQFESSYPACVSTKYSYKNLNINEYTSDGRLIIKTPNRQKLDEAILKTLNNRENILSLNVDGLNMNLNELMNEIQYVARVNNIYGFGMQLSMSDVYVNVNFNFSWY